MGAFVFKKGGHLMSVRKIEFTVKVDSIEPAVKQFAGIQGEHRATEIVFNIDDSLYEKLQPQANNGEKLIYRFDGYDGEGGVKASDTFELKNQSVNYLLEEWLTRFGGMVKVVLVISIFKNDLTEMELFNFPALLQLKNKPDGVETDGENYESMSTLAEVAKESAKQANDAVEEVREKLANGEFKGDKGDKGDTGPQGPQGPQGVKGEKGSSGVYVGSGEMPEDCNVQIDLEGEIISEDEYKDYIEELVEEYKEDIDGYNESLNEYKRDLEEYVEGYEEDLEEYKGQLEQIIIDELAKRGQLKPEFANSIEECTDTSKLYVLPDGYIYAYMATREIIDSELYDESKLVLNKRINSSNQFVDAPGYIMTQNININSSMLEPIVLKIKALVNIALQGGTHPTYHRITYYDKTGSLLGSYYINKDYCALELNGKTLNIQVGYNKGGSKFDFYDNISYFTIDMFTGGSTLSSGVGYYESMLIQNSGESEIIYKWSNTGHAFVPADYEGRIINLEEKAINHEKRLTQLESGNSDIPVYWTQELEEKADEIQQAMETAGRNKSAFLLYTDAHWPNNSKMSPSLLKYLCKNTPINKVNFGGDIIGDPSTFSHEKIKYAYEWRKLISDLPNHHSVFGNHDVNAASFTEREKAYTYILAPEETPEMVVGGESYYYIDNPSEKTRYLYLSFYTMSSNFSNDLWEQGRFIAQAISSVAEGWHIVVIAHRWFQYDHSTAPTVGAVPAYEAEILQLFDEYNARGTHKTLNYIEPQDFTNAKGKVEFCIGGHIHVDYDFKTNGGIPVIITASDTNQDRSPDEDEDSGVLGTTTESAVFGVIADYNTNKITVVGVGRGTSRTITY